MVLCFVMSLVGSLERRVCHISFILPQMCLLSCPPPSCQDAINLITAGHDYDWYHSNFMHNTMTNTSFVPFMNLICNLLSCYCIGQLLPSLLICIFFDGMRVLLLIDAFASQVCYWISSPLMEGVFSMFSSLEKTSLSLRMVSTKFPDG